jgi:hypothetical protein
VHKCTRHPSGLTRAPFPRGHSVDGISVRGAAGSAIKGYQYYETARTGGYGVYERSTRGRAKTLLDDLN